MDPTSDSSVWTIIVGGFGTVMIQLVTDQITIQRILSAESTHKAQQSPNRNPNPNPDPNPNLNPNPDPNPNPRPSNHCILRCGLWSPQRGYRTLSEASSTPAIHALHWALQSLMEIH